MLTNLFQQIITLLLKNINRFKCQQEDICLAESDSSVRKGL